MREPPVDQIRLAVQELAAVFGVDMHDPAFSADPYCFAARALEDGPVHRLPSGSVAVLGHRAAAQVLRDPRFGHGATALYERTAAGARARSFLQLDAPGHTRLRGQVAARFAPRRLTALQEPLRRHAQELVHSHAGQEVDFITDFAEPLAMSAISDVLGVPETDRERFRHDSRLVVRGLDDAICAEPDPVIGQARYRFVRYFRTLAERRRQAPGDDLVSMMIAGGADTGELVTTCGLLLSAGYETTVNLLGSTVLELAHASETTGWQLAGHLDTLFAVVEEALRLHPPVQLTARSALRDTDITGIRVPKGTLVLVVLAAANRDPAVYDDPHAFLPGRHLRTAGSGRGQTPPQHLSFGAGPHFCLGAPLARLEAHIALEALALCRPGLADGSWTYKNSLTVRGPERLPVRWRPPGRPQDPPANPRSTGAAP
ncbi:cytochrome P450 [Streptomyces sp. ISL-11]|uniref:cytochrome P450 n=1 Tax=Streptomyces sp. ISL-11 TaxID=2819174 RepID=UPI001BEA1C4F|nr:cytochrome P450 [Streptomyces sp. ISL-11]MBT2386621.1 cytochrome P450 [Streptomyces sp. ISL-11]